MCTEENKGADNVSYSLENTENFNITQNVRTISIQSSQARQALHHRATLMLSTVYSVVRMVASNL